MVFKKAVLLFWVVIPAVMAISTWTDGPTFDISYDTDSGGVVFQTENLGSGDNLFLFFGADKIGTDVIKFQGSDGTVVDMFSTDESTLDTDLQSHLTPVDRLGTTEAPWNLKTTRQLDTSASDTDSQDIEIIINGLRFYNQRLTRIQRAQPICLSSRSLPLRIPFPLSLSFQLDQSGEFVLDSI